MLVRSVPRAKCGDEGGLAVEPEDRVAMFLRSISQRAGISNHEPWEVISERRRDQWRAFAKAFVDLGYEIHLAGTHESLARLKRLAKASFKLEHLDAWEFESLQEFRDAQNALEKVDYEDE